MTCDTAKRWVAAALVAGACSTVVPSAFAQSNHIESGYGVGQLFMSNDNVRVSDGKADGYGLALILFPREHPSLSCWDRNGSNNGWTTCDFEFPESAWTFTAKLCRGHWPSTDAASCKSMPFLNDA